MMDECALWFYSCGWTPPRLPFVIVFVDKISGRENWTRPSGLAASVSVDEEASSSSGRQQLSVKQPGLTISTSVSEVHSWERMEGTLRLRQEILQRVEEFKYLKSLVHK